MKLEIERHRILIIPENEQDMAYLEDTLGLRVGGKSVIFKPSPNVGIDKLAYLEIVKQEG